MGKTMHLFNRTEYEDWLRKIPENYCPFCDWKENQIVLYETENWLWIANIAPYWKYHTMLIPKRHYVEFDQLEPEMFLELQTIYKKVIMRYRELFEQGVIDINRRYMLFWRLRDNPYEVKCNITKPNHFHLHIVPDREHLFEDILDSNADKVDISVLRII